ncbi:hypothetical protein KO465_06075 [Candidatus Micrarchaeota archaeon]|nr:hypothetical protein [Candidatus Micrarchaeota archaeon]
MKTLVEADYSANDIARSLLIIDWEYNTGNNKESVIGGVDIEHPEIVKILKDAGLTDKEYANIKKDFENVLSYPKEIKITSEPTYVWRRVKNNA